MVGPVHKGSLVLPKLANKCWNWKCAKLDDSGHFDMVYSRIYPLFVLPLKLKSRLNPSVRMHSKILCGYWLTIDSNSLPYTSFLCFCSECRLLTYRNGWVHFKISCASSVNMARVRNLILTLRRSFSVSYISRVGQGSLRDMDTKLHDFPMTFLWFNDLVIWEQAKKNK